VRELAVGGAHAAERELDGERRAVLSPRAELPCRGRVEEHALQQGFVTLQHERRERLAERFVLADAEVRRERRVDIANRVLGVARIEQGQRHAAGIQGGARQGAVRQELEQRRGGLRADGMGSRLHSPLLP